MCSPGDQFEAVNYLRTKKVSTASVELITTWPRTVSRASAADRPFSEKTNK